ncbi:MAG: (2Fe-2S)-binding protein [Deltaproteobacteria bacterium]|nr:(2Fe-2S)-binding protein [Deltaproteobacteria bacterium]
MGHKSKGARLEGVLKRGKPLTMTVDGQPVEAYQGETVASALLAAGKLVSRTVDGEPMGVYCNIGVCHSCLMTVNGVRSVRICRTPAAEGLVVESQQLKRGGHD